MAAETSNLSLVTPTQGTLSGTWGNTVNNGITEYTDIAIAGTLTLNGDGAVTLSNTVGDASASNIGSTTAQYAIIKVTGALSTTKIITAPSGASYSKTYVVLNNATGGSVTIKAAGQTGVTVAVSDKALVAFNGTDYVRVGASAGGADTQVQYNSGGNLAGSSNLTFDGTTLTAAGVADSSLTSGRVTYAGASGNLTDSANLLFDGTTLTANNFIDSSLTASKPVFTDASKNLVSTGTLGVDQGGTGLSTATAYSVVFAGTTGTGAFQAAAGPGTATHVLTSNGAGALPTFQAPAASGVSQAQATMISFIFGF
jgi:hypothetical protein